MNKVEDPEPSLPRIPSANASATTIQRYLRNISPAEPYSADYDSLDYSLQLQVGIANFLEAQTQPVGGPAGAARPARRPTPVRPILRSEED